MNNIVYSSLRADDKPTPEQIAEIKVAAARQSVYDPECPPLTKEQLANMHPYDPEEHRRRREARLAKNRHTA